MFTQTTPKPDSIIVTDNTNDEPDSKYFSRQLSPKSLNEVFKDGDTFDTDGSCISDPMKLLMKAKEPENGQGDLLSSSPTREDTVAMTANNDLTPSDEDVDMLTHQTGIWDKYSLNARIYKYIKFPVYGLNKSRCSSSKQSLSKRG